MITYEIVGHWKQLMRPLFPANAYIKIRSGDEMVVGIDWRLKKEEGVTEKFSRLIKIIIPKNLIETYSKRTSKQRAKADANLIAHLQERLREFHPDHSMPRGSIPPQEEWWIDENILWNEKIRETELI